MKSHGCGRSCQFWLGLEMLNKLKVASPEAQTAAALRNCFSVKKMWINAISSNVNNPAFKFQQHFWDILNLDTFFNPFQNSSHRPLVSSCYLLLYVALISVTAKFLVFTLQI